jgi:uncharacterized protein YggU (UPF0235/DUF167 family)
MVASRPVARINVTVSLGGSRSAFVGRHGDAWKVKVAAAPGRDGANEDLLEVLAGVLCVRRGDLSITRGHASRQKVVEVAGLEPGDVERRLSAFRC